MLKEAESVEELYLILKSHSLHKVDIKKSTPKFFIRSEQCILDVTRMINDENIKDFTPHQLDLDIFDYVIKNKLIDMKDIDYSKLSKNILKDIVRSYPKVIDYIDEDFYKAVTSEEKSDEYQSIGRVASEAAFNMFFNRYIFPRIEKDKDVILEEFNSDEEFSDRHKNMINSAMRDRFNIENNKKEIELC